MGKGAYISQTPESKLQENSDKFDISQLQPKEEKKNTPKSSWSLSGLKVIDIPLSWSQWQCGRRNTLKLQET